MGVVVGLGVGLGLLLVWSALSSPSGASAPRGPSRLRDALDRAGRDSVSVASLVSLAVVLGGVTALALYVAVGALPVAVAFGAIAARAPFVVVLAQAARRDRELSEVWPDAVDNLASAVRAGLSLAEALAGLAERGPEPLRPVFATFAEEYQSSGRFDASLDRLKIRLADPVGDRVVEGLRVAREVGGGDLGRLLRNLSSHLRDDARTRSELEARQSWAVNGARLAVAAPWVVLLLMCLQPDVVARYAGPGGAVVLAVGAGCCVLAYRAMLRIGRLPRDERVLA